MVYTGDEIVIISKDDAIKLYDAIRQIWGAELMKQFQKQGILSLMVKLKELKESEGGLK